MSGLSNAFPSVSVPPCEAFGELRQSRDRLASAQAAAVAAVAVAAVAVVVG
jgi:hypothetical protein